MTMEAIELVHALTLANNLVNLVRDVVVRVEIAGSVRRQKQFVKDVELVAIVDDYQQLFARLSDAGRFIKPGVPNVIDWPPKPGAKYVRMLLDEEIKLDLFIANHLNWGGIYMMRTGSGVGPNGSPFSGFVPAMFARWKRISKGGRMCGGQPTLPDGTMLPVREEEDMFKLCNAKWIPPHERVSATCIHREDQ